MPAPDILHQLVRRFEEHLDSYRSGRYNETQLRREFLDPFFEALGWDVFNRQSYAEIYKEVIHEDSLMIEGGTKAPDYAFRIGGRRSAPFVLSDWGAKVVILAVLMVFAAAVASRLGRERTEQ